MSHQMRAKKISYLRCNATMTVCLWRSGNILVNCVISASLGTLIPAFSRSVRPVSSSTHSRTTELCVSPVAGPSARPLVSDAPEGRAVVITSSFCSCSWFIEFKWARTDLDSSGSARLRRRGGRVEPMSGSRKRVEKRTIDGGMRYDFRFASSER